MASCANCGSTILFGGVREGDQRYCNATCRQQHVLGSMSAQVPDEIVESEVHRIFDSSCPICGGSGPTDVHTSYRVWSALVLTSSRGHTRLSCAACARKAKLTSALFSFVLGWWGVPWGILMTPVIVFRNLAGLGSAGRTTPSPELRRTVRMQLSQLALSQQAQPPPPALFPQPPLDPKQLN